MINKKSGHSKIGPIIIIVLVILCVGYFLPYEINKMRIDAKVRDLCLKEGGAQVFEHVVLSQEDYDRNDGYRNGITITTDTYSASKHDYLMRTTTESIGTTDPQIIKRTYILIRKSDMKTMQISTFFSRRGGDAPTLMHPSHFNCQDIKEMQSRYTNFYSLEKGIEKKGK